MTGGSIECFHDGAECFEGEADRRGPGDGKRSDSRGGGAGITSAGVEPDQDTDAFMQVASCRRWGRRGHDRRGILQE